MSISIPSPTLSWRDHPARSMALLSLRTELSRRRGSTAERGIGVSYETIRRWVARYGPEIAKKLRRQRARAHPQWHLDEMFVSIAGRRMYLWRAVDQNGGLLDVLVQARRDKQAARRLLRKLLKKHARTPMTIVTDKLQSYAAAIRELGLTAAIPGERSRDASIRVHHLTATKRASAVAVAIEGVS